MLYCYICFNMFWCVFWFSLVQIFYINLWHFLCHLYYSLPCNKTPHINEFFLETINKKNYQTNLIGFIFTKIIWTEMTFWSEEVFLLSTELPFRLEIVSLILEKNRVAVGWKLAKLPRAEMTIWYRKKEFGLKCHFDSYDFFKNETNLVDLINLFFIYGF